MLSHKRGYAAVLGRPTTSQPYAFLHKFSVHSGRIDSVAHRPSHHNRLSGEEHISRTLGRSDRRMLMFTDRPPMSLQPLQIRAIGIPVSEKILQRMNRLIADGYQVSDTIRKVIVNPRR